MANHADLERGEQLGQREHVAHALLLVQPADEHGAGALREARALAGHWLDEGRQDGGGDAALFVSRRHVARVGDPGIDLPRVEPAAQDEGGGVQGAEREPAIVAIQPPAAVVQVARRQKLVVVKRLDDRHPRPGGSDHRRAGELGIELVGVDDLGTKAADQPSHGRCGGGIPKSAAGDPRPLSRAEPLARGVGDRGGDELAVAEDVARARGREQRDLVTAPAQHLRQPEAVEIGSPGDVRVLVNHQDAHRRTPIAAGVPPSPARTAPGPPPRRSGPNRRARRCART